VGASIRLRWLVACRPLFHLVEIRMCRGGCALPLAFPFTPTPSAEHGLIDVLTMANCFKAPAIPTYWSRPTVMCHFLGPVAVRLLSSSFARCFSVIVSPSREIGSGQNFGVVGPIEIRCWMGCPWDRASGQLLCISYYFKSRSNRYEKQLAVSHFIILHPKNTDY
jgi:hypothetical protein